MNWYTAFRYLWIWGETLWQKIFLHPSFTLRDGETELERSNVCFWWLLLLIQLLCGNKLMFRTKLDNFWAAEEEMSFFIHAAVSWAAKYPAYLNIVTHTKDISLFTGLYSAKRSKIYHTVNHLQSFHSSSIMSSHHPIISLSHHPIITVICHPIIFLSSHPVIPSSCHLVIPSSRHPIIMSSGHPIIMSFQHAHGLTDTQH